MRKAHLKKQEIVRGLVDRINRSVLAIFADYRGSESGLSVDDMGKLRRKIKDSGGELKVAKNTLLLRAMNEIGITDTGKIFKDPTAVVFAYNDPASTSRALIEFARAFGSRSNPDGIPKVKAGMMEGTIIDAGRIHFLATLPPREELLSNLLRTMQAPIASFARVINAPVAGLVNVLEAIRKQKEAAAT
ncbi:MAG: 50S ribosomal protein L10 [Candidatus Eremiobacteraeota bacterium]|nr:50S ribosomal protein L10 [Candidatus Eremiobacteraeota bacterium]